MTALFSFDTSYARLPEKFFAKLPPAQVAKPGMVALNAALAAETGRARQAATEKTMAISLLSITVVLRFDRRLVGRSAPS